MNLESKQHEHYIRQAIELARHAREVGNHPFGALLVKEDEVLLAAENSVITDNDVTRHAELNLVSQATRLFPADILTQSTLYTSTEPCAMCSGAIFWSGIARVVYSCSAVALSAIAGGSFVVPSREIFARGARSTEVIGPILEDEGIAVHRSFWR